MSRTSLHSQAGVNCTMPDCVIRPTTDSHQFFFWLRATDAPFDSEKGAPGPGGEDGRIRVVASAVAILTYDVKLSEDG
jgi:hypothetical protein